MVVNNASTDDTAGAARRIWSELGSPAPLSVVDEPTPGLSHARERGIASAKFDTLVFADDDNWLAPEYVQLAYVRMLNEPTIGALGGRIEACCEVAPPPWFESVKAKYAVGAQGRATGAITDYKPHLAGAGLVLRKSAYLRLRSLNFKFLLSGRCGDKLTSGEDTELCHALALIGYQIWYDERLVLTHFIPASRLQTDYLRGLNKQIRAAGLVLALYEMALSHAEASPAAAYLNGVWKSGFWALKACAKIFIRGQSPMLAELEFSNLMFKLGNFGHFLRLFGTHYREIARLKPTTRLS